MTPGRILFFGLALALGALYLLNPGPDTFEEFLSTEMAERARGESGGGAGGFLADRIGRSAGAAASDLFDREDYKVASVYTADFNGRRPGGEWTFLGIAGWFIPLERPDADE